MDVNEDDIVKMVLEEVATDEDDIVKMVLEEVARGRGRNEEEGEPGEDDNVDDDEGSFEATTLSDEENDRRGMEGMQSPEMISIDAENTKEQQSRVLPFLLGSDLDEGDPLSSLLSFPLFTVLFIVAATAYIFYRSAAPAAAAASVLRSEKRTARKKKEIHAFKRALRVAVWKGNESEVKRILAHLSSESYSTIRNTARSWANDRFANRNTILHTAAILGRRDVYEALRTSAARSNGKNADADAANDRGGGEEALDYASSKNDDGDTPEDIVASYGWSSNEKLRGPAVKHLGAQTVLFECSRGSERRADDGKTIDRSMLNATKDDRGETSDALEQFGANEALLAHLVDQIDVEVSRLKTANEGNTALHEAAAKCSPSVVKLLASHAAKGSDFVEPNLAGRTPLHLAVRRTENDSGDNVEKVVETILSFMTDDQLSAQDKTGMTALHYARDANEEVLGILLARTPRRVLKVKDSEGNTARELTIKSDPTMDVEIYE